MRQILCQIGYLASNVVQITAGKLYRMLWRMQHKKSIGEKVLCPVLCNVLGRQSLLLQQGSSVLQFPVFALGRVHAVVQDDDLLH